MKLIDFWLLILLWYETNQKIEIILQDSDVHAPVKRKKWLRDMASVCLDYRFINQTDKIALEIYVHCKKLINEAIPRSPVQ